MDGENQDLLEKQKMDLAYAQMSGEEQQDESNVLSSVVADEASKNPQVMSVLAQAAQKLKGLEPTVSLSDYDMSQATGNPDIEEDDVALLKTAARGKLEGKPQAEAVPTEAIESFQVPTEAYTYAEKGDVGSSLGALQEGIALQKSGILSSAAASSQGYMEQAGVTSKAVSDMVNASKQSAIKMEEWDKKIQEQMDKQTQAVEALKNVRIDGDNFWANKSTQDKLMMGIGMALSAYGGRESVQSSIKIIDDAINRDIVVQKANADLASNDVSQRSNLISQLRGSLGDARQAEELARAGAYQQAQLATQAISAKTNSKVASANAQTLLGELKLKEAEALSAARESIPNQIARTMQASINSSGPIPLEQAIEQRLISKGDQVVPAYGVAADGQSTKEISEGIRAYESSMRKVQKLEELTKKYGGEVLNTAVAAEMKSLAAGLLSDTRTTEKWGAFDAGVTLLGKDLFGDPTAPGAFRWAQRVRDEGSDPALASLRSFKTNLAAAQAKNLELSFKFGAPKLYQSIKQAKTMGLAGEAKDR